MKTKEKEFNSYKISDLEERIEFVNRVLDLAKQGLTMYEIIDTLHCEVDMRLISRICKINGVKIGSVPRSGQLLQKIKSIMTTDHESLDGALEKLDISYQSFDKRCRTNMNFSAIDFELSVLGKTMSEIQNYISDIIDPRMTFVSIKLIQNKLNELYKINVSKKLISESLKDKENKILSEETYEMVCLYIQGFSTGKIGKQFGCKANRICSRFVNVFGDSWKDELRNMRKK